jgi:hypothetical protein
MYENEKNETCRNYSRNGGWGRMMEEVYATLIYCKNFANVTMYPQYHNNNFLRKLNLVNSEMSQNINGGVGDRAQC